MNPPGEEGTTFHHVPVLATEVVRALLPALDAAPEGTLVDCTLGGGGHAEALLAAAPGASLVGLDRDPEALAAARRRLARFGDRVVLAQRRFGDLAAVLAEVGAGDVRGILYDLGVSSPHLDQPARGFGFRSGGPLDMRMDPAQALTAADVVNSYPEAALASVLSRWGEERFARRIAGAIVRRPGEPPCGHPQAPAPRPGGTRGQPTGVECHAPGSGAPRSSGGCLMSPEYEGPQDEDEAVAPRRVKHLIVLPGGAAPEEREEEDPGADQEALADEASSQPGAPPPPDARRHPWSSGTSQGGAAAVAQMADAIPLEAVPAQSLRLKLRVISRSVTSSKAPGMPFILFASVLVGAAIFALVVLHVMVDQASFRMDTLESQVTRQQAQVRELRYAVSVQEAPGRVATLASQAGLVPATQIQTLVGPGSGGQTTPTATATSSHRPRQP